MNPLFRVRQLIGHWLRSEVLADALTACLLAAGSASALFHFIELTINPFSAFLISLLPAAIMLLLARYWRWALPLAAVFVIFLLLLWQYKQLDDISEQLADFIRWALTWLQIGQPDPEKIAWIDWLRTLIISISVLFWLPLVRRAGWPLLHGGLLIVVFTPLLIVYPAAIDSLLISLGGLILLLPRRFVRQAHKANPEQLQLTRAPLQFLALPAIIICLILSQAVVPSNTRNWRWPLLVNQISELGELIENRSAAVDGWQPFNIGAYGFQTEVGRLGLPILLSRETILRVTTNTPVLLRGSTLSIYTGSSWQRADSKSYRFGSGYWRLLRQQIFGLNLPDTSASSSFRREFLRQTIIKIEPQKIGMATIFTAGRVNGLSLADDINYPAYFNTLGDVFVTGGLPRSYAYTVTSEVFDRNQTGFDQAFLAIENDLAIDDNLSAVEAEYLQLPEDLPASVRKAAQEAIGEAASPYAKAVALEAFFQQGFVYTLSPMQQSEQDDFVASFLETRTGYCVHFASAMVVMARTRGIPARLAQGFILKPAEGSFSGSNWIAAGNTAHAWAELYFAGIGWLTFDPTPGNSVNDPVQSTPGVSITPAITPTPSPGPRATPTPIPDANAADDFSSSAFWLLLVLIVFVLIALILPKFARHRHRRLFNPQLIGQYHSDPSDRLEFYYTDLLRQLACLDIQPETGETMLDFAERIEHRLRLEGLNAGEALAAVGHWRYGTIVPDQVSLDLLSELHRRVEERLLTSLGSMTYLFSRVLKSWGVK